MAGEIDQFVECRATAIRRASGTLAGLDSLLDSRSRDEAWGEIEELLADPVFVESLVLSSHSVASALRVSGGRAFVERPDDRLADTIFAYALRFCGRATPLGMWASAGLIGRYEKSNGVFSRFYQKRIALLDWEWVIGVAKEIEANCLDSLRFRTNPAATIKGFQLELWAGPQTQGFAPPKRLKLTPLEERITRQLVEIPDLTFAEILDTPELAPISSESLVRALRSMIRKGAIVSDAVPARATHDVCNKFAEIAKRSMWNGDFALRLETLSSKIQEYEEATGFLAIEKLLMIDKEMREIYPSSSVLNVMLLDSITVAPQTERQVSRIFPDLKRALAVCSNVSPRNDHWVFRGEYINLFRRTYGDSQRIDLLDLLNEDMGIGLPDHFGEHRRERMRASKRESSASSHRAFRNTDIWSDVIALVDDHAKCGSSPDSRGADVDSYWNGFYGVELTGTFIKRDSQILFRCSPDFARPGYRSVLSRFFPWINQLDSGGSALAGMDQEPGPNYERMCDFAYLPSRNRLANVMPHDSISKRVINIWPSSESRIGEIKLSDIQVGFDGSRLRLFVKGFNESLDIAITDCLGGRGEEALVRFLREVGSEEARPVIGVSWTEIAQRREHAPEIKLGQVILVPELWSIAASGAQGCSFSELTSGIERARKRGCPSRVGLVDGDSELPIDLDNPCCVGILMRAYRKAGFVLLSRIDDIEPVADDSDVQPRVYDVVLRIQEKKREHHAGQCNRFETPGLLKDSEVYQPCSEWLSLEITGFPFGQNDFLAREGQDFIAWMLEEKDAELFHFLRYADPLSHLRFRFKRSIGLWSESPADLCSIIAKLNTMVQGGCIGNYSIVPYRPEISRFRGKSVILIAEQAFHYDSLFAVEANQVELEEYERLFLAALVGLAYYRINGLSENRACRKDDIPKVPDWYINANRAGINRDYVIIKKSIREQAWLKKIDSQKFETMAVQLASLTTVVSDLAAIASKEDRHSILASLAHLSSNRMLRMGVEYEYRARAVMRHFCRQFEFILCEWIDDACIA